MENRWSILAGNGCLYPEGISKTEQGVHFSVAAQAEQVNLRLFLPGEKEAQAVIPFPREEKLGNIWSVTVAGEGLCGMEYDYEIDKIAVPDPCARRLHGRDRWGDVSRLDTPERSVIWFEEFDWEGDKQPRTPFHETILYKCHVRGLTKHLSSGVKERGTFLGIMEKIPYMKELGVTAVELMPSIEFDEIMVQQNYRVHEAEKQEKKADGRLNYWGYVPGYYFAPKAAYCSGIEKNPEREFKMLVRELHKNGLELVIDLFFTGQERPAMVLDVLRFWVREYHVDGIHLVGFVPEMLVGSDAYLSDTKLFYTHWNGVNGGKEKHLAEYNDGFEIDMRCFLKSDEEQINKVVARTRRNPKEMAVVNYMANTNGFTMMDMVSYEQKHNEENGENNQDGEVYNHSWNCGVEGPTKKKKVLEMRRRQLRNAFTLLFLSQGTPLLLAGDEFGHTKKGNNNSYCQDNACSWLNWNLLETNRELYEFVKKLIAFRKEHPVFHMEEEPRVMDYLSCGCPDISYHGVKAWCPEFEGFRRQIGIMYCGEYAKKADGTKENYFYAAYNMHWEAHEFALPNLPKGMKWQVAIDTSSKDVNGIYVEGSEAQIKKQKQCMVPARTIMVLVSGQMDEKEEKERREKEKKEKEKREKERKQKKDKVEKKEKIEKTEKAKAGKKKEEKK